MAYIYKNYLTAFQRLEGAYAPNTIKSYYADVKHFVDWSVVIKVQPLPLSNTTLTRYIESMQFTHRYATNLRKLVAIKKVNELLGYPQVEYSTEFHLTLRRIRRGQSAERRQARGINRDLLMRMINAQSDDLFGIRNRALLSLGYDFLARRSELVALKRDDIEFLGDGSLRAVIRRSKTDQFGRGRLVYGSTRSAELLSAWLKHLGCDATWIFCPIKRQTPKPEPLCCRSVSDIIKAAVIKTRGERPREYEISGHSLRVGAAQDLLISGHDLAAIMRAGGWTSVRVVSDYLRHAEHNIWA